MQLQFTQRREIVLVISLVLRVMLVYLENNGSTKVNGRNLKCCPVFSLGLTYPTQIRKIVGQRTAGCQK